MSFASSSEVPGGAPSSMPKPLRPVEAGESRSIEEIYEHYLVEVELAQRLRDATADERRKLYPSIYQELYDRVAHHPGHTRQSNPVEQAAHVESQLRCIQPMLTPSTTYLEVGAGDCRLALRVASIVEKSIAVEVTDAKFLRAGDVPQNFELVIGDGIHIPAPRGSVDVAFSFQVMEHLHSDDAAAQVASIYEALKPNGHYVCATPHRYMGPSDVSRYFNHTPCGMHLKEYTNRELAELFTRIGFSRVRSRVFLKAVSVSTPLWPISLIERLLGPLPAAFRYQLSVGLPLRPLLMICMIATK